MPDIEKLTFEQLDQLAKAIPEERNRRWAAVVRELFEKAGFLHISGALDAESGNGDGNSVRIQF